MKTIEYVKYKELLPDEGKVLTDGQSRATAVSMPLDADISVWQEVDKPLNEEKDEL